MLGTNHPNTATALNNLAGLLTAQKNYVEAEESYKRALEIRLRTLGIDHPATISTIQHIGSLFAQTKKISEAAAFFRCALERGKKVLGESHFLIINTKKKLDSLHKFHPLNFKDDLCNEVISWSKYSGKAK
jgi:tetratricopeptide (TPR) repeat protein